MGIFVDDYLAEEACRLVKSKIEAALIFRNCFVNFS